MQELYGKMEAEAPEAEEEERDFCWWNSKDLSSVIRDQDSLAIRTSAVVTGGEDR
jgi:hypothetical protein